MRIVAWEWFRAFIGGYFWMPCPLCGKYFGGHEKNGGHLATSLGSGVSTCADCTKDAERITRERYTAWGVGYFTEGHILTKPKEVK